MGACSFPSGSLIIMDLLKQFIAWALVALVGEMIRTFVSHHPLLFDAWILHN